MTSILEAAGAQPKNQAHGKPIHIARMETGLFTNRSAIHDTASFVISKFYGGYVDALIDGSNMEVSPQLTLIRRPGLSEWSSVTVPDQVNWFYDWRTLDCGVKVIVDTTTSTYLQTPTTQQTLFTKSAGAGQGYYQGVADTLYYGDGVDLAQVSMGAGCIPGTAYAWGIAPSLTAPTAVVTPSASAAVTWQAATVYSTMGLIVDSNNNIQQLIGINANPTLNPNSNPIYGLSGNGQPAWNQTPGLTTADNGWNWTNWGPILAWAPNTVYVSTTLGGTATNSCIIYDPNTQCCFAQINPGNASGTSGLNRPNFSASFGSIIGDNTVKWINLGSLKVPQTWQPTYGYPTLGFVHNDYSVSGIVEPISLAGLSVFPTSQVLYWQVNNTGISNQISGTGGTAPPWSLTYGTPTTDNQLTWLNLGSKTWQANYTYTPWIAQGTPFNVIVDTNGNFQVCTASTGPSGSTIPAVWQTGYNQTTADGGVTWTCVGKSMTWISSTVATGGYYLPIAGWFPPSAGVPFGGAIIIDTHNDLEATVISGLSETPGPPSWPVFGTPPGAQTTDGTTPQITWQLIGPSSTLGFILTKGASFAYSYESRLPTDPYNYAVGTVVPAYPNVTWLGAPPDWPSPLGAPTGSETGQISTASPLFTISTGIPSSVVTLTIPRSSNPAVDTIVIWETLDGGSTLFFLTEVPNPPISVPNQVVTITTPPTTVNEFISAPIASANNPPPAGFKPMAYYFERIWGAAGNFVYASGGPDVVTGNPNESFDPLDYFEFPEPVTRIVPTATGLYVFLTSDVYAILGGPVFDTFFATPAVPGVGLLHYNALDIHGGVMYLFTSDNQFISMDPSAGVQRMGGPIADKLALFSSLTTYVTVHESGNDNAIFVSDGATGWYRLNPSQFPNGSAVWSPFATITGGAGAVLSIEVSPGVHRLLVGGIGSNKYILQRDFSTYKDDGTPYTCFFTMGSINMVSPGQIAGLTFVNLRATRVGTSPLCAFLLNEVSGTFTTFPSAQAYPWQIWGATGQPSSLFSNAYYFRNAGVPALAEHMQVKVSFPAENFANEVLSLTVFGTIEQSPGD